MNLYQKKTTKIQYLILALPVVVVCVFLVEAYLSSSRNNQKYSDLISILLMPTIMAITIFIWWRLIQNLRLTGYPVHSWRFVFQSQIAIMFVVSLMHTLCTTGIFFFIFFLIPIANAIFYLLFISTWWSPLLYYFVLSSPTKLKDQGSHNSDKSPMIQH